MEKLSVIFGTRPEAIKLAPVIAALKRREDVSCSVCVTGQHRDMLDQVLETFEIVPDVDLDLMQSNQSLSMLTSKAIAAIDGYLAECGPSAVLVQGDTATSFCAALTAFYRKISIGHVEAGLRTGNLASPWPEEGNRAMTARLARWHFAPTALNRENLLKEEIVDTAIHVTGNTVIDTLLMTVEKVRESPPNIRGLPGGNLDSLKKQRMVLITGHRRESFGRGFEQICHAIVELAKRFPDTAFVYPVHQNPNVKEPVERILGEEHLKNVYLIPPQGYLQFVSLMRRSYLILTDSGGVQEEAPSLGKPVLVMRDTTERPEAVTAGTVMLVGSDCDRIVDSSSQLLTDTSAYQKMAKAVNPYGDGNAADRIVKRLLTDLL